jgi:hypothetical protein
LKWELFWFGTRNISCGGTTYKTQSWHSRTESHYNFIKFQGNIKLTFQITIKTSKFLFTFDAFIIYFQQGIFHTSYKLSSRKYLLLLLLCNTCTWATTLPSKPQCIPSQVPYIHIQTYWPTNKNTDGPPPVKVCSPLFRKVTQHKNCKSGCSNCNILNFDKYCKFVCLLVSFLFVCLFHFTPFP